MNLAAARAFLADPPPTINITPNSDGLPGILPVGKMVGALLTYGLIAALAGLVISAIVWAVGGNSSNPQLSHRGKSGVLIALGAAVLIGGARMLIGFFAGVGSSF